MIYKWKPGPLSIPVAAQVAGERLERLRDDNGGILTPAMIVDDARHKGRPLHDAFEWRDRVAAEAYRQDQARYMLRHLVVNVSSEPVDEPKFVRAFVSITEDKQPRYVSTVAAMSDDAQRKQLLHRAWAELRTWEKRYREFTELAEIFAGIEKTAPAFPDADLQEHRSAAA